MTRECLCRVLAELLHPFAQYVHVYVQIASCLRGCHTPLPDQPHRLELELPAEPSSLHRKPPASSNTLSRCPRNRQQRTPRENPASTQRSIERASIMANTSST